MLAVITLQFKQRGLSILNPKGADAGMTISVDPNQTAPLGAA